jgi:MoCo/4Fe-4S cofactor protein with predicted Tat translocation signal
MPRKNAPQLESLQSRLAGASGKRYWRSLEELADTEEFRRWMGGEFPEQASQWGDHASRRSFLKLMAASFALAGLQGCRRQPREQIVPYVETPEQVVPGIPLIYASAMSLGSEAVGVLVESHEGRPTMIEGNPRHPGCSPPDYQAVSAPPGIFGQGALLTLYDPDRSQTVLREGIISTWREFTAALRPVLDTARADGGRHLRILTDTVNSPTLRWQLERLLAEDQFPEARWHTWSPIHRDNETAGAQMAFGRVVDSVYRFDLADVVLSLDADFLGAGHGQLRYSREFALRRRPRQETLSQGMNRLYAVESSVTLTGAKADHRLPLRPAEIEALARIIAARLGVNAGTAPPLPEGVPQRWLEAVIGDLQNYRLPDGRGASLVVAGRWQSPAVHALAHAMNAALGNVGTTVRYIEPDTRPASYVEELAALGEELNRGDVDALLILGGNPVFDAPADLKFAEAAAKAPFRVHTSLFIDETSAVCSWHIPETHWLEAWSDARAFDGTASIVQPLIYPLYDGVSPHVILETLLGDASVDSYELVRRYWRDRLGGGAGEIDDRAFEAAWRKAVHDGVIADSQAPEISVSLAANWESSFPQWQSPPAPGSSLEVDLVFRPDPTLYDGRFANNGWLQELPKPLLKLTWDNAALISPRSAESFGVKTGDVLLLEAEGAAVRIPAYVTPGHPDGVATLHLGQGRTRSGRVGQGTGTNVYPLRALGLQWFSKATLRSTRQRSELATTQHHFSMEDPFGAGKRPLVQEGTLADWQAHPEHPEFLEHVHGEATSLYSDHEFKYDGYKWGMAIDLTSCIGCGACVLGCQAENNIPVVGKDQVAVGREMHWIRIDHYYQGEPENPAVHHQPVPCMHCELAPCEPVCPVAATVHDSEGLNEMVYNRCVGTRYCSNNCPYKVRRFNFLQYSDKETPVLKLLRNPDVTVRDRGVMEKCTYCVQRISAARIEVEKEIARTGDSSLRIRDGAVVAACQGACPTEAIVFGDLNDPDSRVTRLKAEPINYALLEELNTRPRTTYLAEIRNPNLSLEEG